MNQIRRNQIRSIAEQLTGLAGTIESIQEAEQDALDNTPENLQSGERYERGEAIVDDLESAASALEEAVELLTSAAE